MDIKVNCPCGSNYEFTDEPVNGRLRFPISCPNCGADGTASANEYIRKSESGELEREQQQSRKGLKGLFARKEKEDVDDSASDRPTKIRLGAGAIGACVGGFVGMMIWFLIRRQCGVYFDFRFMTWIVGALAWGTGALVGLGARLAVPSGSFALAGVAGFAAGTAIMGGQYLAARETVDHKLNLATALVYDATIDYARQADKATNDVQIARLLNDYAFTPQDVAPGEKFVLCEKRLMPVFDYVFHDVMQPTVVRARSESVDAGADDVELSEKDLAAFRQRELPELRAFLQGKPSKVEFTKTLGDMVRAKFSLNSMIVQSWSPSQLLWLVLGVVSAYKIAHNRSETEDF